MGVFFFLGSLASCCRLPHSACPLQGGSNVPVLSLFVRIAHNFFPLPSLRVAERPPLTPFRTFFIIFFFLSLQRVRAQSKGSQNAFVLATLIPSLCGARSNNSSLYITRIYFFFCSQPCLYQIWLFFCAVIFPQRNTARVGKSESHSIMTVFFYTIAKNSPPSNK